MSAFQLPAMSRNGSLSSVQPLVQLPANLLEAFIPGYGTISHLLVESFGVDITLIVSASLIIYAILKSIDFLQAQIFSLIMRFGTSSIVVESDGDEYLWIMGWLRNHGVWENSRRLTSGALKRRDREYYLGMWGQDDPEASKKTLPNTLAKARDRLNYSPALETSQYFWHKGRLFLWYRRREERTMDGRSIYSSLIQGKIICLSRTPAPIKALLEEAVVYHYEQNSNKTGVRRPSSRHDRRYGAPPWGKAAMRISRPLETVMLDAQQRDDILQDIEKYIKPSTRVWYGERGIPYRRGYLFHGMPGTGKTSLSFAIAGYFDLEIYCLSLAEPSITEEDLIALFEKLPDRCVVLLEDIDSAGLVARNTQIPTQVDSDDKKQTNRISLSGLLNVIDGVGSQEGRVLIMTTNHIEALDSALLRPGRTDMRVHFKLASKKQAEDMFVRMFAAPNKSKLEEKTEYDVEKLGQMACTFAEGIPEDFLSPADIQGFLMNCKEKPSDAIANCNAWIKKERELRTTMKKDA